VCDEHNRPAPDLPWKLSGFDEDNRRLIGGFEKETEQRWTWH